MARFIASVMLVSGCLLIVDVGVTLLWQEPVSAFMAARPVASLLRGAARLTGGEPQRLTARRYFSLLTQRWADPVVVEPPDLMIRPSTSTCTKSGTM